jgi:hypothetical protein
MTSDRDVGVGLKTFVAVAVGRERFKQTNWCRFESIFQSIKLLGTILSIFYSKCKTSFLNGLYAVSDVDLTQFNV